jgi:hypothetical protein
MVKKKKFTVENGGLVCNLCQNIFKRRQNLLVHIDVYHNNIKKITCPCENCGYKTGCHGNLYLHIEKKHKINFKKTKCFSEKCKVNRRDETSLINHMKICTRRPSFKTINCNFCDKKFLTEEGLEKHKKLLHTKNLVSERNATYEDLMNLKDIINFN